MGAAARSKCEKLDAPFRQAEAYVLLLEDLSAPSFTKSPRTALREKLRLALVERRARKELQRV